MKPPRYSKVLGLAVGERSVAVAEVVLIGDRSEAKRLAEFTYPSGIGPQTPVELGAALAAFLKENSFSARHAVVGLPAKWLLVKTKEVPPTDDATIADMLRLQAEGEFSSELKDLVYDYTGRPGKSSSGAQNVLLVATPRKYVDMAEQICTAARLDAIAITASATVLGAATGRTVSKNAVVLTLASGGAELTAQSGDIPNALRHLRAPAPEALFLSELRRAVSTLPVNGSLNGSARELILWDGSANGASHATGPSTADRLAEGLGMRVKNGDLPSLGVTTSEAARNGGGRAYAPAVALALSALGTDRLAVDFLHSRLAPPKIRRIANWMIWSAIAAVLVIGLSIYGYVNLQKLQGELAADNADIKVNAPRVKEADTFVKKVEFAQQWKSDNPRYVACLRDITRLVPEDGQTYATTVNIKEKEEKKIDLSRGAVAAPAAKSGDSHALVVNFFGKAPTQERALAMLGKFQANKARFSDIKFNGTSGGNAGRIAEVSFSITCTYNPAEKPPAPAVAPTTAPAAIPKR